MNKIILPQEFNYIAAFLTFACQLRCPYCINHHGGDLVKKRRMTGQDWIKAINRIEPRPDLPISIQGGEPTVHKDFYEIINGIRPDMPIDLLTNLECNINEFMDRIPAHRIKRESPYASIRVSYHIGQSNRDILFKKVRRMLDYGYHIGIWTVTHPDQVEHVAQSKALAESMGIDFRLKEFLGPHKGVVYGTFRYPDAVNSFSLRLCDCKTTEFLIDPMGDVYRCHSDLYARRTPIGNMADEQGVSRLGEFRKCAVYGACNSCDLKIKNNRFQQWGYSSVEIKNISEPIGPNPYHIQEVENTYGKHDST